MSDDIDPELDREVDPGLSDQYRKASPFPLFVALGFALGEVGVVLGLFPMTVAGLLLFGGTVAAILHEAGYIARPWRAMLSMGAFFAGVAALVLVAFGETLALAGLLDPANGVAYRMFAVFAAGVVLGAVGGGLRVAGRQTL